MCVCVPAIQDCINRLRQGLSAPHREARQRRRELRSRMQAEVALMEGQMKELQLANEKKQRELEAMRKVLQSSQSTNHNRSPNNPRNKTVTYLNNNKSRFKDSLLAIPSWQISCLWPNFSYTMVCKSFLLKFATKCKNSYFTDFYTSINLLNSRKPSWVHGTCHFFTLAGYKMLTLLTVYLTLCGFVTCWQTSLLGNVACFCRNWSTLLGK